MSVEAPSVDRTAPPAPPTSGPLDWIRQRLFNTWYNALLTLVIGSALVWAAVGVVRGLLGADLRILRVNLTLFMVGLFPRDQLWRPWAATFLIALTIGVVAGSLAAGRRERAAEAGLPFTPTRPIQVVRRFWPVLALIVVILAFTTTVTPTLLSIGALAVGVAAYFLGRALPRVLRRLTWLIAVILVVGAYVALAGFGGRGYQDWGGLHLNLFLTIAGIALAFPLGLLLAMGRRSSLPAVRALSVGYIEFIRGVPLITLLLAGAFAIGFLIPRDIRPGTVTRMLIAITLFEAAYIAEVVRGGLQAVPRGQVEAAQALALTPLRTQRLIVLPQALRATIPAMVGQFISLFKDTTLVSILGITELLNVAFIVNSQEDFLGRGLFVWTLGFAGLIFWVGSYTMSREAGRLERRLGVGER